MTQSAEKRHRKAYIKYHGIVCSMLGYDPTIKTVVVEPVRVPKVNLGDRLAQYNLNKKTMANKKEMRLSDADDALQDQKNQIRKENLKKRASSVRPPGQQEYRKSLVPDEYNCKRYVQQRIQLNLTGGSDMDPLKVLSVYRKIQPCPLRSTIKKLKMSQAQRKDKDSSDYNAKEP